jgi:rubrerythrin
MGTSMVLSGIIGFIALIVFFVMAAALANISRNIKNINRILTAWSSEHGYGTVYICNKCKKSFTGRQSKCPHCGDVKSYE